MKQQFLGCHLWLQIQTWHMCCHLFADETAVIEVSSLITDFDVTYALLSFYRWDSSFWGVIFNYRFWRVMCVVIFLQMRSQKNSAPPWGGVKKLCPPQNLRPPGRKFCDFPKKRWQDIFHVVIFERLDSIFCVVIFHADDKVYFTMTSVNTDDKKCVVICVKDKSVIFKVSSFLTDVNTV